jgi:leucyl-tRNA synthetase
MLTKGKNYSDKLESSFHKTIKKVTEDIEGLKFNTAIAALMSLMNEIYENGSLTTKDFKTLLILSNPFAPHITEELWQKCSFGNMVTQQKWCEYDIEKTIDKTIEIPVQINGKLKGTINIETGSSQENAMNLAKHNEKVSAFIEGKEIVKVIFVKDKLLNIVIKN